MNRENERLKNKILDLAIRGELVRQDPKDEPASVLLQKIKQERKKLIAEKKIKKEKYSEIYKDSSDNHYYEKFEDGTTNDITEEIPFEIPESWKWCRHNDLLEIVGGSQPPKSKFKSECVEGYIRLFQIRDYGEKPVPIYVDKRLVNKFTNKGDILLARYGASVGKVFIAENGAYNVALAKICYNFNEGLICKRFLYFYYISSIYQVFIKNISRMAQAGFNKNDLNNLFIPLPPIEEQKRIVHKIDLVFEQLNQKEQNDNKIIKLKENLKFKILDQAIRGELVKQDENDESAEVLINKILDEKREIIKTKQIKKGNLSVIYKDSTDNQFYEKFDNGKIVNITDEIPFDVPQNWCWTRLENLTTKQIKRGKSPKYIEKSNVSVFAQKCNQKNGIITLENAKFLDETTLKKYDVSDYLIESDIVINSTGNGTLGRVGIIKDKDILSKKVVIDSHVTLIRLINKIEAGYIFYFLKHNQKYLEAQATGSTNQTELSPEIIKKILIPLPNTNEQSKIIEKVKILLNEIETAE